MKVYDSDEKFCHCNFKSSLTGDMTISFSINLKDCINGDYKLIEKDAEFLVKLSKKRKIYFYIADNSEVYKIQAKSDVISDCNFVHVAIVRNTECKRTVIYVNGKVSVSECIEEEFITIPKACGDICCFYGNECADYEMKCVKIHNVAFSLEDVKQEYVWNLCNKKELLQEIFCNNYANFHLEDNTYYYIMTPNGILFFEDISKAYSTVKNEYPKFAFTYYNVEKNEKNLPLEGLKVAKYEDLCKLFDVDEFLTNIITWQLLPATNNFQIAHPKNISTGKFGYWSFEQNTPATTSTGKYTGFTPFTPYFGNDTSVVPADQKNGNLKNGFIVSFIKLLLNQYLCTDNIIYKNSLIALVDFLIALPGSGASITPSYGIPDEYPVISPATSKVSIHQGNYINYLKILDVLLENECIENVIDETKILSLKDKYDNVMTLLLKLQFKIGGKPTIWGEYYTPNATIDTDITDDGTYTFLTVPESAEILSYLMNLKCPSTSQKNAIKSAVEWLKLKSLDKLMGNNHVLYFSEIPEKMQLDKNNYTTTPSQLILHPHYFDLSGNGTDKVSAPTISNTYSTTFNGYTFTQQIDVIGTWVQCVFDLYANWEKIYDTPCNTPVNPPVVSCCCCKKCKKC
jgi:PelA/Pel-15E family pectate lyase